MARTLGFSDGSSMSVDRTREAGERTLGFADGSSIKADRKPNIKEDAVGSSRPLLSKLIGGAAVAFSLRDLNDKQGESKVVNVRRSADNEEKIFKAKEVPIINKWVNGEQETTLPCDVASAESAYSLRKVKKSYNGPIVRLRRTMDNCEVDVYPDSDGKVSEKSRIVNKESRLSTTEAQDKLNTSAKTLGEFIKPVGENLIIDNVANVVGSSTSSSSHYNTLFDQRVGGKSCFYLSAQGSTRSSSSGVSYHKYNQHYLSIRSASPNEKRVTGENVIVKYEYYVPSITPTTTNGQAGVVNTCRGLLAQTPYSPQTVTPTSTVAKDMQLDTWHEGQTIIHNGLATNDTIFNGIRLRLAFKYTGNLSGSGNVYYDTNRQNDDEFNVDGHGCYIRNIRIYSDECDAKVVTWYDQGTANDDATAITHDSQPNLVENGVLLSDGISFDGINNFLSTDGVFTDNRSASIFTKVKALTSDASGSDYFYTEGYSGTNGSVSQTIGVGITDTGNIADITASTDIAPNDGQASALANGGLISLIGGSSTTASYINGTSMGSITTPTNADGNYTITTSGGIGGHSSTSSLAKFSMEELILYASDQSANRFKIESNINKHYGLYTFQGNGFVETWYDQSGNDRHASQIEEQAQPYIVINGVSVKTATGVYAVDQDGRKAGSGSSQKAGLTTEYNPTQTDGSLTEYSVFALYELTSGDGGSTQGIIFSSGGAEGNAGYGGIILKNTSGSRVFLNNTDGNQTGGGSSASASSFVAVTPTDSNAYNSVYGVHLISGHFKNGVGLISREDGVTSADVEVNAPIPHASKSAGQGKLMLMAERTFQQTNPFYGRVAELIFFEKDHRLITEAIEANINNQYQIY